MPYILQFPIHLTLNKTKALSEDANHILVRAARDPVGSHSINMIRVETQGG
jgi:hypothetical protein